MVYDTYFPKMNNIHQTVPAGVYRPDDFALYAETFDLSLLPSDGEVPQLTIQTHEHFIQNSDYLPATISHDSEHFQSQLLTPNTNQHSPSPMQMKTEKLDWISDEQQQNSTGSDFLNPYTYQYHYPSPLPSPPQEYTNHFTTIYPPSPCSSVDYNNYSIKQEFCLLPPSPPDSNGAPSPLSEIKTEPETDNEVCIDIESLLNDSFDSFAQHPKKINQSASSSLCSSQQQDHQLLREYLQDTSFQKKHNLKPLALESLLGGWSTRGDIEPVFSLALEQIRKDVEETCVSLDIPPDPLIWTSSQVQSWLTSQASMWNLQEISNIDILFPETGLEISQLSEEEFTRRLPESGSTLYSQLVVWKSACSEVISYNSSENQNAIVNVMPTTSNKMDWSLTSSQTINSNNLTDVEDKEIPMELETSQLLTTPESITTTSSTTPISATTPTITRPPARRQGGSHIHLWQFLKELLASPETNGAIRWLDRGKGVFKIEDSVRVARLWGRRKNRPAMNYDKLSRSIRQYYKKGIMKKTERSQRLVYQFCHPYCL